MRVELLGPVKAYLDDDEPAGINGVRLRTLLSRLALEPGRPVSAETLIGDLWGEQAPSGATAALHTLVARLRRAIGGAAALELVAGGYRLPVRAQDVDACRFEELVARGRRELAAGAHREAAATLRAALDLWRGEALADVREAPFADRVATRLHDLRDAAAQDRIEAELHLGGYAEVLGDLATLAAHHPLSERLAGMRMRALAAAGRQSDALAVYAQIRGRLADELGVDPAPELEEIHLALLRGEMERPPAPGRAAPNRLPAQLTGFVGREPELARLAALLPAGRLVTVVGPGGSGKTRLALEAVARDPAHARGRVWFVPLAEVGAADPFLDAVLTALDDRPPETRRATSLDRVCELLGADDALLVLDNCEHLIEDAADLADQLLLRLPRLRILATSRRPLAITGETLCHLSPLDVPDDAAQAAQSAAVRLFAERAAQVQPGFTLDATTLETVVEICRRLDGLPLALELAAAKVRSMSLPQIAARLDDRFRLLTPGSRAAPQPRRTLLAVVERSWDLLDEQERTLARRLAGFPGGAELPELEAACADASLPAGEIVYVLGSLVEKSVVQEAGGRYRMLETVRAYALRDLLAAGAPPLTPGSAR
ncbi:AfsR/SARP family transcriptional regulator [Nonomuraea gerenzanensis]|uniref:Signal transduction response regulator / Disease resistance domain-containing protein n=1 Tax=Nonomuraea gerenzanensis TaxID=93944 RepID=A0A1M4EC89_9ACTN|nr:BTAD domain-containing putative transcriptional regulator [Nonomuraea gerenzanensis]UBU18707.1 winged helix-turn-helix domain-containing protein [Nonomuraea gerenzanensis]SBO96567.1 Signal transduction response regulator / Disease resistance domain-containing protein [Nonomuraea gerenzanensis]